MNKLIKYFNMAILFTSTAMVGCASTESDALTPLLPLESQISGQIKVIYDSQVMAQSVGVESANIDNLTNSPRLVTNIKNIAGVPYTIEYQTVWANSVGVTQQSSASWKRKSLPANGEFSIVDMAKEPNLTNVKIYFRIPSDVEIWSPIPNPLQEYYQQQNENK